jgi:hypothetical protein
MSDYRLEITGRVDLSDYSNINDYIELVDKNDQVTISMDSIDSENVDLICKMLEEKRFNIASKGGHNDGRFYISAKRNK